MELTGKITKYCTFAWKLVLQNYQDFLHDGDRLTRNEGNWKTEFPIEGEVEQFATTCVSCKIWRALTKFNDPQGHVTINTLASVGIP